LDTDSGILPKVCEILDFRRPEEFPVGDGGGGEIFGSDEGGSGGGDIFGRNRRLQFEGELCQPNVYDLVLDDPRLSTLADLLDRADMTEVFLCAGPFTLLAPTNEAFAALDPTVLADLLRPENQETLQEILLYHILSGLYLSDTLEAGEVDTLLGDETVTVSLNPIMFNQAGVIEADIISCNGAMQIIDAVLVPDCKS
jgi:uncharacterized surface protein with fasciclin (FAS1) repeats